MCHRFPSCIDCRAKQEQEIFFSKILHVFRIRGFFHFRRKIVLFPMKNWDHGEKVCVVCLGKMPKNTEKLHKKSFFMESVCLSRNARVSMPKLDKNRWRPHANPDKGTDSKGAFAKFSELTQNTYAHRGNARFWFLLTTGVRKNFCDSQTPSPIESNNQKKTARHAKTFVKTKSLAQDFCSFSFLIQWGRGLENRKSFCVPR